MIYVRVISQSFTHEHSIETALNNLSKDLPEPCRLVTVYSPNSRPGVTLAVFETKPKRTIRRRLLTEEFQPERFEDER